MMIRNLPEDLVVEIFSRFPAVSLARLRLVSKEWNAMIKDGIGLDKKHFANAPMHSKALVLIDNSVYLVNFSLHDILNNVSPCVNVTCQLSLKDPLSNNSSEQVGILNVFHCDGLLLCTTRGKRLVVWNPCTGETMWIQPRDSYETNDCYALGRSSCNKYKILRQQRLYHDDTREKLNLCEIFWQDPPKYTNHEDFEYEIYDFTSNSWRGVVETTDLFIPRISSGMYVNGVTYWFDVSDRSIVSFDFSTERFGSVDIPEFDYPLALSVTGQGQQLCMLSTRDTYVTETNLNLWIATKSENTGETSWSKFPILQGHGLRYRLHFRQGMKFLAYQVKEEIVVVSCNAPSRFSENIIHGVARHKFIELVHHGEKPRKPIQHKSLLLSYIPSLVQIQHGILWRR